MSISIVIKGLKFSFPVSFLDFKGHNGAGVYAIIAYDKSFGPVPYKIIYYGEASNFSRPNFLTSHRKYSYWTREADPPSLYIAIYTRLPESSKQQKKVVKAELLSRYKPICNN